MSINRAEFDDLSNSSASMLVVTVGNLKLYSKILKILPDSFKLALCAGLRHEPIKEIALMTKRRVFATLSKFYSDGKREVKQVEHRIEHNFGIPIPFCLDNKATTVRLVIFLIMNDRSMIPVCRSMVRLSSTRDPTTAMKWFPMVKYNGFTGIDLEESEDNFDVVIKDNIEKKLNRHYIVGSIQILTRRILQDRIGEPDLHDIMSFSADANETKNRTSLAEQYDDSSSEYEFSDDCLSSTEYDSKNDNLFNGKYSSKIKDCFLESSEKSLEGKIPFPFLEFKDLISKFPTLKNIFHFMPLYNQKINTQILMLRKRNKEAKVVLLGDDFFSKYRSGISVPIKIPYSVNYIMNDSLDWQTWLCKSLDIAVMQSVEAYSKSSLMCATSKYKAGKYDMNKKSRHNFKGNKLAVYNFDFFMKAMESNMDVLLLNTIFNAAATEFARDIIDDVIFCGRNQTKKFTPYKNLFIIWEYIIKRGYQELGMDYSDDEREENNIDFSTFENKVGEDVLGMENISDLSDNEDYNIQIKEKNYCKLENDFDEFSDIARFDENILKSGIEKEYGYKLKTGKNAIPLYNSLKRKIVDSIERESIQPLPPDHPIASLRLFENDLVFIHHKTIGKGLMGILVLGDDETSPEDACKIYTREISAHMAINEAILRTKIKKAIRIYNTISKNSISNKKILSGSNSNSIFNKDNKFNPASKRNVSNKDLTEILLRGIDQYINSQEDIFHPSIALTTINPSLITCVDYSGFRMIVRPLPSVPFTICDWPLPIQSNERNEINNIEKCLNINNILHPTKLISGVKHLPILLEYSIGVYNFYNFHHTYNIFPKDPWVSDVRGERINWGNSSTDDYYHNYSKNSYIKKLGRRKCCIIRPLFIKQSGAVQDMLKHRNKDDKTKRFHYVPSDLFELWRREIEPTGFCLICSSDIQLRTYGFNNMKKDQSNFNTVTMELINKYTETTSNGLIKIKNGTHCSLCGKSIRIKDTDIKDEVNIKTRRLELMTYIGSKVPFPIIGNYDDGAALRMNRTKLLTSYMQSTSDYYSEWSFSEGDIFRRDEIFWERKPGLYCLPRTCIKGGGNLLGTGLDTIKYLLSQAKFTVAPTDINSRHIDISDFNRENKFKILKGIDVFDESKRQDTVKLFFNESNIGQEIILLSNSLHTNWIAIVLNQLESIPAFAPYDSITLENFLHSRGVNCNLLGRMLNFTRSPWLKQLLSMEIVARTIKNLVPKIIKTLYLPGAISYLIKERGNLGKYCPCHTSSPSVTMLYTIFKLYITSIKRRNDKDSKIFNSSKLESQSKLFSTQFMNTDVIADQEKLIKRKFSTDKSNTTNTTSLSIQSPIYWNEIFSSLNNNNWDILNIYNINMSEISKLLLDWAVQFFNIEDNIINNDNINFNDCNNHHHNNHHNNCNDRLSEKLAKSTKLSLPYWVLECLFNINQKSLTELRRHRFHQITIIQIVLTNLFNLILGDSPNSQLFWSTCISKLCSWEFSIAENSISKYKIPIGALYTSLQYHTGIKFFLDIKKLIENLSNEPSFPIKYDDFNTILPKTKRKKEQYYSESLPIWGILETPEIIRLPRYNNFSLISTPTISQKFISLGIKLSASYCTNVQFLIDYLTHTKLFQGSERHLIRQDWIVQESWLELLGYFSYLESDKICLKMLNKVINLFPQDHIASIQARILQMWSYARLRNVELIKNRNNFHNKFDNLTISEKSIPHEISVSTLIFEIIELSWSVIHPIIIDVYTSTALIHFIRGNWKSCEEILEKAITKSLILSSYFDNTNDVIHHFNKVISNKGNINWEFENKDLDSKKSLKYRIINSNIKYLMNLKETENNIYYRNNQNHDNNDVEELLYDKFYHSQTQYIPKLLDTIENPYPNKVPRSPPKLRIGWLLKQLGKVRLIHALHVYHYNKSKSNDNNKDIEINQENISSLVLLSDPIETLLELSCFSTQWALDIFDYYLGTTTLETASCCFDLAYGLILLNEVINDQSQVLLKRSYELLTASFDVNSSLLLSSHIICIENLIQLALVYEKSNSYSYSLKIWEIILEQLSIKCRAFDDNDYRLLCEFSLIGWFVPNKYFYIPLSFNQKNNKNFIIDEYIYINNYDNNGEKDQNQRFIIDQSKIIISAKNILKESSQWNIKNLLMLLSYAKERIFYLFMNICNGNHYHKRLFRLFLLASYLKRGDKLVNLKDWEPILSLNQNKYEKSNKNFSENLNSNDKNLSGLLFSVIYESNSWLYETEETNLAVSSFINEHPTKISREKLFSGDGFSGPLSILHDKENYMNEILYNSKINSYNNNSLRNGIISDGKNNNKSSSSINNYINNKNNHNNCLFMQNNNEQINNDSSRVRLGKDFNMSGMIKLKTNQTSDAEININGDTNNSKKQYDFLKINVEGYNERTNPRHLVSNIKDNFEYTMIEGFFINLIKEAENDIKIIWRNIKEQTQLFKNIKKNEIMKIQELYSRAQYEQRINRLSKLRISEILNDDAINTIDYFDFDIEKGTLTKSVNESAELSTIAEVNTSISCPIYKSTLVATINESKNLLSKIMVHNTKKITFDDEFEQIGNDSKVIYNSILKKETIINDNKGKDKELINENTKKFAGMRLNLENTFFTENTETDNNIDDYIKSSPLSYRSEALDILVSIIYNTTNFKEYFANWRENKIKSKLLE